MDESREKFWQVEQDHPPTALASRKELKCANCKQPFAECTCYLSAKPPAATNAQLRSALERQLHQHVPEFCVCIDCKTAWKLLAAQPAPVRPCAECGKPEDNCVHVRYGNDVEAIGVKHYYIPKATEPALVRPEERCPAAYGSLPCLHPKGHAEDHAHHSERGMVIWAEHGLSRACSICGKQGVTEQDSHGPCGLREADNDKV